MRLFQESGCQQLCQFIGAIKLRQIIVTADMGVADINLWNGAASGSLHHFVTADGIQINANFFDLRHPSGAQ
mgnify:CR=1 FL=1